MKKSNNFKINWIVTLFLIFTPIIGIGGLGYILVNHMLHIATLIFAVVWLFVSGIAITAGYHRLFSHCSYQAKTSVKIAFLLLGAASFEGSVLEWCTDHRNHHRYVDTDRDPYNIKRGFWFAHIGWLFTLDSTKRDYKNVEDLSADRWVKLQHKYFYLIAIFTGLILPASIAALWHDALGGLIIAGVLRVALNHHLTFCINSVCHLFGKRPYSTQQTARDNWVTALFTYGEGFHNFHHQFALDYRNGIRAFHFDPAKWLIFFLSYVGLANNLQRIGVANLTRYRLRADEQHLWIKFKQYSESLRIYTSDHLAPVRDRILQVAARIEAIEKDHHLLKVKEYKVRLRAAKHELKNYLYLWKKSINKGIRKLHTVQ